MAKIGVFDSGVGGQSVATAIALAFPEEEVLLQQDQKNLPYGTKTPEELLALCLPKLQILVDDGCEVIVIACNSVSTTILDKLRAELDVPLIGVEPMLEVATGKSSSGVIAVCATPATLASDRYRQLRAQHADSTVVLEPDCSEWAYMIEADTIDRARIRTSIEDVLQQGADVIVLGCTHYHWIERLIKSIAGDKAMVLQPEADIVERVRQLLGRA